VSWRDILPVHPAADLLPLLKPDELRALAEDIQKNGLRERPILWREPDQDYLLDGRNRLDALELNGARFLTKDKDGLHWLDIWPTVELSPAFPPDVVPQSRHDPVDVVISANIMRRHLPFAERTRIVAELLKLNPERSDRQVASTVGVSHPTVAKVRRELEKAGDVVTVTTSKDTRGRAQPRRRPPTAKSQHMATAAPLTPSEARAEPGRLLRERLGEHPREVAAWNAFTSLEEIRKHIEPPAVAAFLTSQVARNRAELKRTHSWMSEVIRALDARLAPTPEERQAIALERKLDVNQDAETARIERLSTAVAELKAKP
jgi:Trp operon repressor